MAIYNVKIVDDAGASTTQPIGASSDNVLIQDENISLTQKLENINADRDALLEQIKKVESRHFTINKHIDSTNVPTGYGFYKIAKLPDGETLATGTEWLISVNENVTQVVEMEDGGETSYTITTTSKILFKDSKFTLISFDNEINLSDELKEQWGSPSDSDKLYFLNGIVYNNKDALYLYGAPYSYLFENSLLNFVDIGVTFLELSNSQECFLEGVNFEFIPESEFERDNTLSHQYLNSDNVETDTKTSFTINSYEDEVLESGWYKIAYYDYGFPSGEWIVSLQSYTDETGIQMSSFLLTTGAGAKIIPISQTLTDGINIDQIRVIRDNGNIYILIHLNLGEYESLNDWDCCVTIHNINYQQYIDYGEETLLWVAPREPFSKITEDEIDDIYTSYNITNDPLIYPLTNINGGAKTISTYNLDPNKWYRIASRTLFFAPCKISIVEYLAGKMAYCELFCDSVGYPSDSTVKCKTLFQKGDTSFDTVRIMTETVEDFGPTLYIDLHTLSSLNSSNCFITIETVGPEFSLGSGFPKEYSYWQTDGIILVEDNDNETIVDTFNIEKDVQIATTADIGGGGGAGNSNHQFTVYSSNIASADWYRVAKISGSAPHAEAMVHIADETTNNTRFLSDIMCILDPLSSSFKTLTCNIPEDYYTGFNEIRYTYVGDESMVYLELYYNWDTNNSPSVTVENINPINIDGEIVQWEPVNFEIANGSTQVIADYRLELSNNIQIATTKDLEELCGGGVNDEALDEVLDDAKAYTNTKCSSTLSEAKSYADSLVNGLLNGQS